MSSRKIILAIATAFTVATSAQAAERPLQARSVSLGSLSGVSYYTVEPNGYRVVVALARHDGNPALRFETTLGAGQDAVVSIPQELGFKAQSIKISRVGDEVRVQPAVQDTASAE
jgi:hypothetical protein